MKYEIKKDAESVPYSIVIGGIEFVGSQIEIANIVVSIEKVNVMKDIRYQLAGISEIIAQAGGM